MRFRFACAAFAAGLSAALSIAAPAASAQTAPLNPRVALKVGAIVDQKAGFEHVRNQKTIH